MGRGFLLIEARELGLWRFLGVFWWTSDGSPLFPYCPLPLSGFRVSVSFINHPLWSFSLHPSLFLPHLSTTTSTTHLPPYALFVTMSPSTTPIIPSAPLSSVFPQAVLESSYDHLRDWSSAGGYMNYGSQVSGLVPTCAQVRSWD